MAAQWSEEARERLLAEGGPILLNDWRNVLFIHFRLPAAELQDDVPFPLDLLDGDAHVSLVAFRLERLRPAWGGAALEWLLAPASGHGFLNVRTYVRVGGEAGIYFLREWVDRRLSAILGPVTFGLPYRFARLRHDVDLATGAIEGAVEAPGVKESLRWRGRLARAGDPAPCAAGSLSEFLLERYSAFTLRCGRRRRFRVWHPPWLQVAAEVEVTDATLLERLDASPLAARAAGACFSGAATGVWIGRPRPLDAPGAAPLRVAPARRRLI